MAVNLTGYVFAAVVCELLSKPGNVDNDYHDYAGIILRVRSLIPVQFPEECLSEVLNEPNFQRNYFYDFR